MTLSFPRRRASNDEQVARLLSGLGSLLVTAGKAAGVLVILGLVVVAAGSHYRPGSAVTEIYGSQIQRNESGTWAFVPSTDGGRIPVYIADSEKLIAEIEKRRDDGFALEWFPFGKPARVRLSMRSPTWLFPESYWVASSWEILK